jgi:hypothetical protein
VRVSAHCESIAPFLRLLEGRGRGLGDLEEHAHGVHVLVGWGCLSHLNQRNPKRPDVSLPASVLASGRVCGVAINGDKGEKEGREETRETEPQTHGLH